VTKKPVPFQTGQVQGSGKWIIAIHTCNATYVAFASATCIHVCAVSERPVHITSRVTTIGRSTGLPRHPGQSRHGHQVARHQFSASPVRHLLPLVPPLSPYIIATICEVEEVLALALFSSFGFSTYWSFGFCAA
jgi:hypothetical protein